MHAARVGIAFLVGLSFVAPVDAQQPTVAGVVIDAGTLRPLSGVQIGIPGTQLQVLSDAEGRFVITGVSGVQVTLRASAIGYRPGTQTVAVGDRNIRMTLVQTVINLEQIVVTGTPGGTERRALGNALAQIDAAELVERQPITDIGQLLKGRVPGVAVSEQMGVAGGGSRILIRGPGSLAFSSDPIIYVDGVRVNSTPNTGPSYGQAGGAGTPQVVSRLNDINPQDIESIEIIKGPAAATLYGTEASAGVIQIITKKGQQGRTRFGVQVRQGASSFNNAAGRLPMTYGINPSTGQVDSLNFIERGEAIGEPLFRTGHLQEYSVNISGGQETIGYYASLGFEKDEGVIPTNAVERLDGRLNLSITPNEKVDARVGFAFNAVETSLYHALYFGSFVYGGPRLAESPTEGFLIAPARTWARLQDYTQDVDRYEGGLTINYMPVPWLTNRLTAGLDVTNQRLEVLRPVSLPEDAIFFGPIANKGFKSVNRATTTFTTVDYASTASLKPTEHIGSNTSVGLQYYRTFVRNENLFGEQFPAPGVQTVSGAAVQDGGENFVEDVTVGLYVQQQFSWKDRFFLTAGIRADDNSAFGADFDLVSYPKVGASWVISEEGFWGVGFVNTLKLRGAYGESGQQPSSFAAIRTYSPITGEGDQPAGSPQAPGNPDLGPERGKEIELGFESSILGDRIGVDFTYYNKKTDDAILQRPVAPSSGFQGFQFVNVGKLLNRGFEVAVRGRAYEAATMSWDFSVNVSKNHNEVLDLGEGVEFIPVGWIPNRHQVGFPIDAYFRKQVVSAELDAAGNPINVLCDGGAGKQGVEPGGAAVPCSEAPFLFLGSPIHDFEGSVSTTVTLFDRLRLSALVDFRYGGQLFESLRYWNCAALLNHEIDYLPERYDPKEVAECRGGGGSPNLHLIGTSRIQSSGFTKLRELAASFMLPQSWSQHFGADQATITVAGRNLHTWTGFDGLDPETFTAVNFLTSTHTELTMPLPRSFMVTVNATW